MGIKSNNPSESYFNFFGQSGKDAVGQPPKAGMVASGGNVTRTYTDSGKKYRAHIFTASGSLVVTDTGGYGANIEYFVVAGGGGGGGTGGGGGGAGGVRTAVPGVVTVSPVVPLTGNPFVAEVTPPTAGYTVTVGNGGEGAPGSSNAGSSGQDSYFGPVPGSGGPSDFPTGVTATGGGGGGGGPGYTNPHAAGLTGGSGGAYHGAPTAGSFSPAVDGNTPPFSPIQGHPAGKSGTNAATASGQGGGGGAGSAGGWADSHPYPPHQVPAGDGGFGIKCLIAGPTYPIGAPGPGPEPYGWFAGGGGGGANWSQGSFGGAGGYGNNPGKYPGGGNPGTDPASVSPYAGGGTGGGSTGPNPTNNPGESSGGNATNGTANTGGGGGGANQSGSGPEPFAGGDGGSGIVIVRYQINPSDS